jgi:hypothetical protein
LLFAKKREAKRSEEAGQGSATIIRGEVAEREVPDGLLEGWPVELAVGGALVEGRVQGLDLHLVDCVHTPHMKVTTLTTQTHTKNSIVI